MKKSVEKTPGSQPPSPVVPALVIRDSFNVTWRERLTVLGTAAGLILSSFILGFIYSHDATMELIGLIPASMVAIGKFLPLWGIGGKTHFNPWELGLVIWALDTWTVLVVVYGLEPLYRIGPIKAILARMQTNASLVLTAYPSIRRAAVVGVVMFVLFPFAGTGALVGAFLGILLGLQRFVLISAVSLGGLIGGMLMAFAAVNFGEAMRRLSEMQSDPVIKWLMIGSVILVLVAAFWWLNRIYKRALEAARKDMERETLEPEQPQSKTGT